MKASKREIRELAAAIYARIAPNASVTDANIKGVLMLINAAHEQSALFYAVLEAADKEEANEVRDA